MTLGLLIDEVSKMSMVQKCTKCKDNHRFVFLAGGALLVKAMMMHISGILYSSTVVHSDLPALFFFFFRKRKRQRRRGSIHRGALFHLVPVAIIAQACSIWHMQRG